MKTYFTVAKVVFTLEILLWY